MNTLAALAAALTPQCRQCTAPVQRTEIFWDLTAGGDWVPRATQVCSNTHRTPVDPC